MAWEYKYNMENNVKSTKWKKQATKNIAFLKYLSISRSLLFIRIRPNTSISYKIG